MGRLFRFDALFLYAVLYLLFLYAPVLLLPLFSFNDSIYIAFPLKGFTFEWYRQMAENGPLIQALQNSLKLAVTVSIICTALGLLAAKGLTRPYLPGKRLITGLLLLPLVVPVLILGIGLLVIARQIFEIPLSLLTVGAGHVLLCLPFATLVLMSRLEGFDRSLEEASLDLGESAGAPSGASPCRSPCPASWRACFCASPSPSMNSCSPSSSPAMRRRCRCSSSASCASRTSCRACWLWAA